MSKAQDEPKRKLTPVGENIMRLATQAVNSTGRPEPVLTDEQWQKLLENDPK